jgi:ketosteroid isomerase-like protein
MHPNAALIEKFYRAFQQRDGEAMAACYAPNVHFSDPVFTSLDGDRARAMWKMLCARGKDLTLEFRDVNANDTHGSAHWEARYSFSRTGRQVHNVIDAHFHFKDGLISEHVDSFSFWRWARQALGPAGLLLGWTPLLKNKVRATAAKGLDEFLHA